MFAALQHCAKGEGATEASLTAVEEWIGKRLPTAYREFMMRSNGAEGFVTDSTYLVLWPAEQITELNEAYSVSEFAPGLLLIGSDGADVGFAFDMRNEAAVVKEVPFVGMSHEEARTIGEDFNSFVQRLSGKTSV